jgi:hypothetical protein
MKDWPRVVDSLFGGFGLVRCWGYNAEEIMSITEAIDRELPMPIFSLLNQIGHGSDFVHRSTCVDNGPQVHKGVFGDFISKSTASWIRSMTNCQIDEVRFPEDWSRWRSHLPEGSFFFHALEDHLGLHYYALHEDTESIWDIQEDQDTIAWIGHFDGWIIDHMKDFRNHLLSDPIGISVVTRGTDV